MQTVALGVYLTETTHDALWLGLLTVCAWTPALIGAPLGGVIADRVVRQRWIQMCIRDSLGLDLVHQHESNSFAT